MIRGDRTMDDLGRVAVVGGTGTRGRGLAYRFALAGCAVEVGSWDAARAQVTAEEIAERLGGVGGAVTGASNAGAAAGADVVLLAVPGDGHPLWCRRSPMVSRARS
ncbi:NAD(P)-binding domain-containing protein [Nonomuraea sp. NPDC026600]|uniref:NAD(P)-binding domain-containing protein n=1 Tax=Nonomuraea sp. NPDC026600 TaxID=3155363 RepID=UPI00340966E4